MSRLGTRADDQVWLGLRLPVRQRLSAAVCHVYETGAIRRKDLMRIGEISAPQASFDLNEIKRRLPLLLTYDATEKCYRRSSRADDGHTFRGSVRGRDWKLITDFRPSPDDLEEIKDQIFDMFEAVRRTVTDEVGK